MTLLSIYDVACPWCGKPIGEQCVDVVGRKRTRPHVSRRAAFQQAVQDSDTGGSE